MVENAAPLNFTLQVLKDLIQRNSELALKSVAICLKDRIVSNSVESRLLLSNIAVIGFEIPQLLPLIFDKILDTLLNFDAAYVRKHHAKFNIDFCVRLVLLIIHLAADAGIARVCEDPFLAHVRQVGKRIPLPADVRSTIFNKVFEHFFEKVIKLDRPRCSQYVAFYLSHLDVRPHMFPGFDSFAQYFLHRLITGLYKKDVHPSVKARFIAFTYSFIRSAENTTELVYPVAEKLLAFLLAICKKLIAKRSSTDRKTFMSVLELSAFPPLVYYLGKLIEENRDAFSLAQAQNIDSQISRFVNGNRKVLTEVIEHMSDGFLVLNQLKIGTRNHDLSDLIDSAHPALDLLTGSMKSNESISSLPNSMKAECLRHEYLPFERCSLDFHAHYFAKKANTRAKELGRISSSICSFDTEGSMPMFSRQGSEHL